VSQDRGNMLILVDAPVEKCLPRKALVMFAAKLVTVFWNILYCTHSLCLPENKSIH